MSEFIAKYGEEIHGALTGFDRLVFRSSLRSIAYAQGMDKCRRRRPKRSTNELAASPSEWMPWNCRETLGGRD